MSIKEIRERAKEEKRNYILDTAERLFYAKDFNSVTMEEIANKVGINKATLYHYFTNKDSLFFAIVLRKSQKLYETYLKCVERESICSEKARKISEAYYEFGRQNTEFYKMFCAVGPELLRRANNEDTKEVMDLLNKNLFIVCDVTQECMEDGIFRNDLDPMQVAIYFTVMYNSVICLGPHWKKILESRGISHEKFVADFARFIGKAMDKNSEKN